MQCQVTVERRQKWFESLDVEELLLQRGISFRPVTWNEDHWLQLDDFDNTEYDIRTPEQWLEQGWTEAGFLPVRACGLRLSEDGGGVWQECVAVGLTEDKRFQ
ncbi:unnamed protein product, partial [Prorocentrum cordatum]